MPIVFFGSSEFSLASLQACLDSGIPVQLIVTTPDTKKGRGLQTFPAPVKTFAESKGIPVIAPEKLKQPEVFAAVEKIQPDFFVVASYGKIIPANWLKIPRRLALNVHPSLLPKYRGAAPIHWPILNGDTETGLSLAEVTDRLDAGDIFYQKKLPLNDSDNAVSLTQRLASCSYDAVLEVLAKLKNGEKLSRTPQKEEQSTYARKLTKEDGRIHWDKPAQNISAQVRGLLPWPAAYTFFQGQMLQILDAAAAAQSGPARKPGEILEIQKTGSLHVQTGRGILEIRKVKPAGKGEMGAAEFARGKRLQPGACFEPRGPAA